jgi:hypothetical protein
LTGQNEKEKKMVCDPGIEQKLTGQVARLRNSAHFGGFFVISHSTTQPKDYTLGLMEEAHHIFKI